MPSTPVAEEAAGNAASCAESKASSSELQDEPNVFGPDLQAGFKNLYMDVQAALCVQLLNQHNIYGLDEIDSEGMHMELLISISLVFLLGSNPSCVYVCAHLSLSLCLSNEKKKTRNTSPLQGQQ